MKIQKSSQDPIDQLLKQNLKDDLPTELENRLTLRLRQFREKTEKQEKSHFDLLGYGKVLFTDRLRKWKLGRPFGKSSALTFASVAFMILLAAAIFTPVTGSSGLLAESFSTLTTSLYVSRQVSRVQAMLCSVEAVTGHGDHLTYSIAWTPDRTRVRVIGADKSIAKTLLIEKGRVSIVGKSNIAVQYGKGLEYMHDPLFQPISEFLSPASFQEKLQGKWESGGDRRQGDCGEDVFSLLNLGENGDAEVWVDTCTFLPTRMIQYRPLSTPAGKGKDITMSIGFRWEIPSLPRVIDQGTSVE